MSDSDACSRLEKVGQKKMQGSWAQRGLGAGFILTPDSCLLTPSRLV